MAIQNINRNNFDYIGDNISGRGSKPYSADEMAGILSSLTGEQYTATDVKAKFGKDTITDQDLYDMMDTKGSQDGYLSALEAKTMMGTPSGTDLENPKAMVGFNYKADDKDNYSLSEVSDKIQQLTGKKVSEADISKLVGGRDTVTDMELGLMFDRNFDKTISKDEVNNLISNFNINYSVDDDGKTDTSKETLYQGDGKWNYSNTEFKDKIKNDLGITLTDADLISVFGDQPINDRLIEAKIDMDKDGHISVNEINKAFKKTDLTEKPFNFLSDTKTSYTDTELTDILNKYLKNDVSKTDITNLLGSNITDFSLLNNVDMNDNGVLSQNEIDRLLDNGSLDKVFGYLADTKTEYTTEELSKELSNIGMNVKASDLKTLFGKDKITDADLLNKFDGAFTGVKDGTIRGAEVLAATQITTQTT